MLLSYDNTNYVATYRLANDSEITMTDHYHCCSSIGRPAVVYPYTWLSFEWVSCDYSYTDPSGDTVTGTISEISSDTITVDTTEYDKSPYGVLVYKPSTDEYLSTSDVLGESVTLYLDSMNRAGLIIL